MVLRVCVCVGRHPKRRRVCPKIYSPNSTEAGSGEAANFTHKLVADGFPGSDDQNSPHSAMWHRRRLIFCSITHQNLSQVFILQCKVQGFVDSPFSWKEVFFFPPPVLRKYIYLILEAEACRNADGRSRFKRKRPLERPPH